MIRKMMSYKHWSTVTRRVSRLLLSPDIPVKEKLLFGVPVLLYWILPDALPFMPLDDIAITMLLMNYFSGRMERRYGMK